MKTKIIYFFVLICFVSYSQELLLPISSSGRQVFAGKLFFFGLTQSESSLELKIYSVGEDLKTDSIITAIKGKADDHLNLYADTLHGFLNIYVQKTKSRNVKIVRVHRNFTIHCVVDDVELTRLNSISFFEKEILYSGTDVFTVKSTTSDTAGKQFYLNKYSLRSDKENFEYDAKWQFPFERKFIESVHVVMADKRHVFVYVNIAEGVKKGQWYLKIDAGEGKLLIARKISGSDEASSFLLHRVIVDSISKSHFLFGGKMNVKEYDPAMKRLNLAGRKSATFFLTSLDTMMEITSETELKVPVTDVVTQTNKQASGYLAKTIFLKYKAGEGFQLEADIFKSAKSGSDCFRYSNTISFNIIEKEGIFSVQKSSITSNPAIDQFYSDADPSDFSGIICADSINDVFSVMIKPFYNRAKIASRKDATGNYIWILAKSNFKKNKYIVGLLAPEKKIYKMRSLAETEKGAGPFVEIISEKHVLIGKNHEPGGLHLQLFPW